MRKLLFLLLVMALSAQTAWAQFAGGDGSAGNPYQIETMEQLQSVSGGDHYIQMNDLDAEGFDFTTLNDLTGVYNGNNYVISNLTIDTDDDLHVGLFGVIAGGEVRNLGLENLDLIAPAGEMVGGITGMLTAGGNIENVFVTGNIDGWLMASGIAGHVVDGVVNNSYAHVNVDADDTQNAGIAGRLSGNGEVHNAYAVATVTGGDWYGVVVGNNDGGTVSNIYWDADQSSPVEGIGHGDPATNMQGLSTEEMTGPAAAENMDALDFESIWATTEDDYPVLLWQVDQTIREPESPNMLQVLPHEFNMDTEDINWDRYTFHPFEGARLVRVENPDASGINETEFVLEYEKQDGAAAWGGFFYQVEPFNLTDESVFTMQVWSPREDIEAIMKLEQFEGPGDTGDLFADVTQQGEWMELEWDLSDQSQDIDWNRVTIIMDLDMDNMPEGGPDHTWYIDEFSLRNTEPAEPALFDFALNTPADGDTLMVTGRDYEYAVLEWQTPGYVFRDLSVTYNVHFDVEGGDFDDPVWTVPSDLDGRNAEYTALFANLDQFLADQGLEPGDSEVFEWTVTAHLADDGDEVDMRFADSSHTITMQRGDVETGLPVPDDPANIQSFPLAFNIDDADVDWDDYTFNPFDGAVLDRIQNPDQSGVNTTDYVLTYIKAEGPSWAGFFYHLDEPVDPAANYNFSMQVWSPVDEIPIVMKLELQDPGDGDIPATPDLLEYVEAGEAQQWIELEWDLEEHLSADMLAQSWDRVVIIAEHDGGEFEGGSGGERYTWYLDEFRFEEDIPTSADQISDVPDELELNQNYPNPFNPTTSIEFSVPEQIHVTLEVYNTLGQRVAVLQDGQLSAGHHTATFDATQLASGVYIYRLEAGDQVMTRNMMLVK